MRSNQGIMDDKNSTATPENIIAIPPKVNYERSTLCVAIGGIVTINEAKLKIISAGKNTVVLQAMPGTTVRVLTKAEIEKGKKIQQQKQKQEQN